MLLGYATKLFGGGMSAALLSETIVKQIGLFIYLAAVWRTQEGRRPDRNSRFRNNLRVANGVARQA